MKKRLLSLALSLCLLAALLPAGALTAHADNGYTDLYCYDLTVDSPVKGGKIQDVTIDVRRYNTTAEYYHETYHFIPDWTWYDENGQIVAENRSLEWMDPTQMVGKTYMLKTTSSPTPEFSYYDSAYNQAKKILKGRVITDDRGETIEREYSSDWSGNPSGPDGTANPCFSYYRYQGQAFISMKYWFDPVCLPIETVVLGVADPVPGQPVDFSAVSYRPEQLIISNNSENFHIHGVRWTDKTEGLAVTGGSFKAGHEYEASVYVEPTEFYYFSSDGSTVATVNGHSARITDLSTEDRTLYEITCTVPASYVHVSSVTLNKTSLTLAAGNSEVLTATVAPANAVNKDVIWSSSDPDIAAVDDNGRVKAYKEGTATVTATAKNGGKTCSCLVTVTEAEEYGLEIAGVPVTSLNREDILGHESFSFDGDHTLTVRRSCLTDERVIYNKGVDGLVIRAEGVHTLKSYKKEALITNKDTTITGPGYLTLESSEDYGIFVAGRDATLTIRDIPSLEIEGHWGIAAPNRDNSTKLVINHASVTVNGTSSAVCDFRGGITLKHCELVKPEGGSIIGWGDIVDAEGDRAAEVQIDATALENPFVDVHESDWFYDPVLWAYYNEPQITAGTDETHFSPAKTVLRSDAMVFFWAAQGRPTVEAESNPFKDVSDKHWAHKAVMWAVKNGITGGTDKTHFSPSRTCSRSEILQFLYASMGKPGYSIDNPYSDINTNHWYYDGAIWAYEKGLEKGEEGKFNATTPCTRAYVVTYLYRFMTRQALAE